MAAGRIVLSSNMPARDRSDRLVAGALLYVYTNGTTTKASIYTDAALTTPLANPVVANSSGAFVSIWAEAGTPAVPVLYTLSLTGPNGESLGNPSVWDDFSPSLDYASDATAFARTLLDDADAGAARTTLAAVGTAELAASGGSALVGFLQTGTGAVVRTVQDKAREWVSIRDFGASTASVDNSVAIQKALDAVKAAGGGEVHVPAGEYLYSTTLVLWRGVSLVGDHQDESILTKNAATTVNVTDDGTVLAGGYTGALPLAKNACLVLDGSGYRYVGTIRDLTLRGTLGTPGNYETPLVEFGIVSTGSISDSVIHNVNIETVQYAEVYPLIFSSSLTRIRRTECLRGQFINKGTSLFLSSMYSSDCRDYGYHWRAVYYSLASNNACDNLNDPTKYPTRTRTCNAYEIVASREFTLLSNADEQTWGRSVYMDDLSRSHMKGHMTVGIGSDYTGAAQIAWLYSTNIMRGSSVRDCFAFSVKPGGLTYGGANAANHHNIYFEGETFVVDSDIEGNLVAATIDDTTEAGWGNNVPTTWLNMVARGGTQKTITVTAEAQTMGDLVVTYGADNAHYRQKVGAFTRVWGCLDVGLTYTTASGLLILYGLPANLGTAAALSVKGVEVSASPLTNIPGHFLVTAGGAGLARQPTGASFTIADLPSGASYKISYEGFYLA